MGLGLILGAAAAGGLQGLGEGATKSLQMSQEAQQKEDLVKLQAQLEEEKDLRIGAVNQGYHVTNAATDFANTTALHGQDNTAAMQRTEAQETGATSRNAATNQMERDVTGAKIESAEKINANDNRTSLDVALTNHTTFQPSADGHITMVTPQKDGTMKTALLMDPEHPDQPLMGMKDLPQSQSLLGKSYFDEAVAFDHQGEYEKAEEARRKGREVLQSGKTGGVLDLSTMPKTAINRLLQQGPPSAAAIQDFNTAASAHGYGPKAFQRWALSQSQRASQPNDPSANAASADPGSGGAQPPVPASMPNAALAANSTPTPAQVQAGAASATPLPPPPPPIATTNRSLIQANMH